MPWFPNFLDGMISKSDSFYIKLLLHVFPLNIPFYALAQPWNISNSSPAAVGGKEFDGGAMDDITVLQRSVLRCPCDRRTTIGIQVRAISSTDVQGTSRMH